MNKGVSLIALIITIIAMILLTILVFEATKQESETMQAIVYIGGEEKIIDVEWYFVSQAGVATIRAKDGKEYQTTNYTIITISEEYD